MEHKAQRQHQLDRQVGVAGLPAWRAAPGRGPASDGVLVQPQHQVTTSAQPGFVGRPVRDAVARPWDAVTTGSVRFEGHRDGLSRSPPPCTNADGNPWRRGTVVSGRTRQDRLGDGRSGGTVGVALLCKPLFHRVMLSQAAELGQDA